MTRLVLLALAAVTAAITAVPAEDGDGELEKLAAQIQQEVDARKDAKGDVRSALDQPELILGGQLRAAIAGGNAGQIETSLRELSSYLESADLRRQSQELAAKYHLKRAAEEKEELARVETALQQAGEAVRTAKVPADLDATLSALGAVRERREFGEQASSALALAEQKAQPTLQFVKLWQDYLAQDAAGDTTAVHETLERLAGLEGGVTLIPRSQILSLLHPAERTLRGVPKAAAGTPDVEDILGQIKTPADLHGALQQLEKLRTDDHEERGDLRLTLQTLSLLEEAYREFQAGLSTRVETVAPKASSSAPSQSLIASVRAQIISLVLPRYLGLPEDVRANAGEGPHPFLDRIAADAAARGDYLLVAKARETQRLLRDGTAYNGSDNSQAGLFVTACNQEAAGQFSLAVGSFERALASPSDIVPPKVIGGHLAAIKADHPQDFQQGIDSYLSPPLSRFGPGSYPPGYPPGRPPGRMGMPGYNGPDQQAPSPALAIPAASPRPAAAASPSASPPPPTP